MNSSDGVDDGGDLGRVGTASKNEPDTARSSECKIRKRDVVCTSVSIIMRAFGVCINIKLASDYYQQTQYNFFTWTLLCIVLPMCMTSLIYGIMRLTDGDFERGLWHSIQMGCLVIFFFYPFRYLLLIVYMYQCKQAERLMDAAKQEEYYQLCVREESDVALIRLFECFLEIAPQKILQICIVVKAPQGVSVLQIIAICWYMFDMAMCLINYHRYMRYAQSDKFNISSHGIKLQYAWHLCITFARTICITFMAVLYPIWTIFTCCLHVITITCVTFVMFRPESPPILWANFTYCLCSGCVYLFTYIPLKDGPTFHKYAMFYTLCMAENVASIAIFATYEPQYQLLHSWQLYLWITLALTLYLTGIAIMIVYYSYYHPRITARRSLPLTNYNL